MSILIILVRQMDLNKGMQQAKAKFELAKKEMGRRDFESMCMPVLT
jgi:hypothetical protein